MPLTIIRSLGFCLLAALAVLGAGETRFHRYTKQYKTPPHPIAGVRTATYLGSEGVEWLCAADALPDGTVVVAGCSVGPSMKAFGGVKPVVLGRDGKAPAYKEEFVEKKVGPRKNRRVVKKFVFPGWTHPNATGFVAGLSADGKAVAWVARFPWKSVALTDLMADATGIYLAGRAGDNARAVPGVKAVGPKGGEGGTAFVGKLSPDGRKLLWAASFADARHGPMLRRLEDGSVMAEGARVYLFDADGKLLADHDVKPSKKQAFAINPKGFGSASGWDTNTHTGREPWRQPHLLITHKDRPADAGETKEYYSWGPKLVGSKEGHRLVSDSSFRFLRYDDEGMLWAVGWSDGGNTVLSRLPEDLHTGVPFKGLGFSLWGATVGSFCHILRLDPRTGKLLAYTVWSSYLQGKERPNGGNVANLRLATDGSILMCGGAPHHLIQTGDAMDYNPEYACGPYLAVLKDDLSSIRYSTIARCAGATEVRTGVPWGIRPRQVKGRHLAFFASGATGPRAADAKPEESASLVAPVQKAYAGGLTDGYLVVMDLGP